MKTESVNRQKIRQTREKMKTGYRKQPNVICIKWRDSRPGVGKFFGKGPENIFSLVGHRFL